MAGGYGILAYTIKSSVVAGGALTGGGYSGIYGSQVVDCQVTFSAGHGIYALVTAINSYGYSSTNGIGVYAVNAQNCYGYSSSYYGLSANIAQNCYGSSTSGVGLSANHLAISCFGSSQSGTTGLSAVNANFCFGSPSVSVSGNKYNMP